MDAPRLKRQFRRLLLRSRTMWGALIALAAEVLPLVANHVPELQAVALGFGLPDWTKYALQGFGLTMVIYARWDDARKGVNPA